MSYPWSLDKIQPTVEWAIDDLGDAGLLGKDNVFRVHTLDSECSQYRTNVKLTKLYYEQLLRPIVIIGPTYVFTVVEASRLGTHWGLPVITAGGSASTLRQSGFEGAPMLTRVGHTDNKLADALESLLLNYSWTRVAIAYNDSQNTCYRDTCYFRIKAIKDKFNVNGTAVNITMDKQYSSPDDLDNTLKEIAEVARGKLSS
ncbi:NPR3 [Branchiostoma lanceolatum]|uniref:NPR3 protein n=1 Tax=Branchiostoma lanceolatum TaxID=7740 RepID=A0A8J9ZIU8_BRALA|nr:NPR3 [Branchiostoma lanceolatum]